MNKEDLLYQATQKFLSLLIETAKNDADLLEVIDKNSALFAEIKMGLITPPYLRPYKCHFHSEDPKYGGHTPLFSAESEFISALKDWRSKPWYPN